MSGVSKKAEPHDEQLVACDIRVEATELGTAVTLRIDAPLTKADVSSFLTDIAAVLAPVESRTCEEMFQILSASCLHSTNEGQTRISFSRPATLSVDVETVSGALQAMGEQTFGDTMGGSGRLH